MILALHQTVYEEWNLIFISLFLGAFLVAVYDIFRILRILIKHKNIFVHIQDFFFWIHPNEKENRPADADRPGGLERERLRLPEAPLRGTGGGRTEESSP